MDPQPEPFTQRVPNGRYPVTLAIAHYGDDQRVAFARVQFSSREPVTWKMAITRPTRDPSTLGPDEYFGYGVDAGAKCFMDALAGKLLNGEYVDDLSDRMDATYQHTRSWAVFQPDPSRPETIICFSSGFGDGSYPSFFGLDSGGEVCQLVADFCLFFEEPPETKQSEQRWWRFWR